jgi:hypothetical protein
MARKQRTYYPTKKTKGTPPAGREPVTRASLAVIDTTARLGRKGIVQGSRVTILGSGLYAGEVAVVERLVSGVIPAAVVRTEGGRTRQVRTVDLEPVGRAPADPSGA